MRAPLYDPNAPKRTVRVTSRRTVPYRVVLQSDVVSSSVSQVVAALDLPFVGA